MPIKLATTEINKIYNGTTNIIKVYKGTDIVWSSGPNWVDITDTSGQIFNTWYIGTLGFDSSTQPFKIKCAATLDEFVSESPHDGIVFYTYNDLALLVEVICIKDGLSELFTYVTNLDDANPAYQYFNLDSIYKMI